MKQIRTLPFVLTVGLLVVLIGGCSSITGVNPFKKKENCFRATGRRCCRRRPTR